MKKQIVCFLIAIICLSSGIFVNAQDENYIFAEYKCYKANVYVCDTEHNQIILRNVLPIRIGESPQSARHLEYTAIDVSSCGLYDKKGNKLTLDFINGNLLDSRATVLVGVNGYGYTVVYLKFN